MSENFNEQNENNQNEYGTSQNIYGNIQTTYGDTQNSYGSENNYGGTQNSYGGTQNTYGYNNQPQYQSGMENQQQELVPQMSVGQWMLTYLLVNIPIVNIVMYIIWLIGKNPKDAIRKNWARGQLFMGLIIFGIMLIFTIIALTVSTLVGGSSSGSSKIDTGVTSDYYAADDDGDQAEDIFNHDSGAATLPDTSEDRPVVDAEPMDGTWEDMSFFFDGHEYSLPFAYSEIEANGWTFDIADYGYEDGYVMNAGDQTYESIELKNPDYPDVTVKIGFVNLDSSAKDITECDIYAFSLDTCYGFDQVDAFPIMSVSGGLTIGMDEQSAVAIMGECDDVYEAEEYNSYSYQDEEYNRHLDFEVNDENGITYFDLTYYQ